jgi:hypothetical protein
MAETVETSPQPEQFGEASSQTKSQGNAPMDVNNNEQDEAILKLNEDELRELQKGIHPLCAVMLWSRH